MTLFVEPENVTMSKPDDPELLAAGAKARADLDKLRSHFASGIPPYVRLAIKASFIDDEDRVEWMWVDVVAFRGDTFEGTLANEPQVIESLQDGQKVRVKLAHVRDYLHEKENGARAGAYSLEVFKKKGSIERNRSELARRLCDARVRLVINSACT
jgi:uncharacterized protein YegJ (DUF2314 family)